MIRFVAAVGVLCAAASARADTVGIATKEPQLAVAIGKWLTSHGRNVVDSALSTTMVATLHDCFVIEDPGCARSVVEKSSTANAVVFVSLDRRGQDTTVATHWLVKGQAATSRRGTCVACTEDKVRDHVLADLAHLTGLPVAAPALTQPAPAPSIVASPRPHRSNVERSGLAVGVEVGEPTSATVAWFIAKVAIGAGLGTGTFQGPGVAFRVQAQVAVTELAPHVPLRVGLGGRFYHHGYELMSIDEVPHTHYGVFATAAIALDRGPLQLYAELAPGIDVARTRSCTLASGPNTICPHAQGAPVFIHFVVGARWFLGH